jgi:hypothetical protein
MTNDTLAFVGRINALGAPIAAHQTPVWLQEVQAVAGIATTIGVLIALYIAAIREPRKDAAERRHHAAQIDALRRAEQARIAAQARKVLPSCVRTPMFGDASWTVRIDNASDAVVTILGVDVVALDTNCFEVPRGCRRAAGIAPVGQVSIRPYVRRYTKCRGADLNTSWCRPSSKLYVTRWWVTLSMNGHAPCRQISTP